MYPIYSPFPERLLIVIAGSHVGFVPGTTKQSLHIGLPQVNAGDCFVALPALALLLLAMTGF